MIAKHVQSKKGNYRRLVSYLLNPQDKQERVGKVAVTHCQSSDPDMAVVEVLNTQAQNTRSGAGKTYHLLVSFREGEHPSAETIKAIEERLCAGLGFGGHQRISVVHHDTENLHVHIAINKIHPTRHTIHTPFNDYKTLGRLCSQLEREFGLAVDNHQAKKHGDENAAADMEHHAGVESLLSWVKRTCRDELCTARSWNELHDVLAKNGLELRKRGNGFILSDESGITVKASSVDRTLSKESLEERLGQFQPSEVGGNGASGCNAYQRDPVNHGRDTTGLYARYREERTQAKNRLAHERQRIDGERRRLIDAAKRKARLKRAGIRLLKGDRLTKKFLYGAVSRSLLAEIKRIHERCGSEKRQLASRQRCGTWVDWLCTQAKRGDEAALASLRARRPASTRKGNALHGRPTGPASAEDVAGDVTRKGTVIYRKGSTVLRDTGARVEVSEAFDSEGLQSALRIASTRFGNRIHVEGSELFRNHIARAAAGMDVHFDDADMERLRAYFVTKEGGQDGKEQQRQGTTAGGGIPANGGRPGRSWQSDLGAVGAKPPPAARDHLRTMSELGVVRVTDGGEVLLPRDVPGHVEQQGTAAANGLRRDLPAVGGAGQAASTAAAKYVFDREQTRSRFSDIPNHRTYDGFVGEAHFGGIRAVDGTNLVLLRIGQEVQVMPIDDGTLRRIKRLRIGSPLTVAAGGAIRTKGRSR
jgi:hypothetical protein